MELYDRRAAQAAQEVERAAGIAAREADAGRINIRVAGGGRTRDPFPDQQMPDLAAANASILRGARVLGSSLRDGGYQAASRIEPADDYFSEREPGTSRYDRYGNEVVGSYEAAAAAEGVGWDGASPPVNYYVDKDWQKRFRDEKTAIETRDFNSQQAAIQQQNDTIKWWGGNPNATDQRFGSGPASGIRLTPPDNAAWRPAPAPTFLPSSIGELGTKIYQGMTAPISRDPTGDAEAIAARK